MFQGTAGSGRVLGESDGAQKVAPVTLNTQPVLSNPRIFEDIVFPFDVIVLNEAFFAELDGGFRA